MFYYYPFFSFLSSLFQYLQINFLYSGKFLFLIFQFLYFYSFQIFKLRNSQEISFDWENPKIISRRKKCSHTILYSFINFENSLKFNSQKCYKFYLTGKGEISDGLNNETDKNTKNRWKNENNSSPCEIESVTSNNKLNKIWKFSLIQSPEEVSSNWIEFNYNEVKYWSNITLPGHWQCQGYDLPIYTNTSYPFQFDPPRVRRNGTWKATDCDIFLGGTNTDTHPNFIDTFGTNTTGLYRTIFQLPSEWRLNNNSSRFYIVFEGVDSAIEIWINEKYVGYSQDSCLPAEFDITDIISEKDDEFEHLLCCKVRLLLC